MKLELSFESKGWGWGRWDTISAYVKIQGETYSKSLWFPNEGSTRRSIFEKLIKDLNFKYIVKTGTRVSFKASITSKQKLILEMLCDAKRVRSDFLSKLSTKTWDEIYDEFCLLQITETLHK